MKTFAEWLKEHGISLDNPIMPLVREAWFAGAASYAPPEAGEKWQAVPVACHNLGINFVELQAEVKRLTSSRGNE